MTFTTSILKKNQGLIPKDTKYIIGIDPGVTTGIAIWDRIKKSFVIVGSCPILKAMNLILIREAADIFVRIEDARLRKWFGKSQREVLQGAGSIKRDCQIWEEFLELHNIPHEFVAPKNNITKLDAKMFARYTGYKERTNEHSRDAAMLVYQL